MGTMKELVKTLLYTSESLRETKKSSYSEDLFGTLKLTVKALRNKRRGK